MNFQFQEAHVFKYADLSSLFFQCQISITLKEDDAECPRPSCPEPSRGKRSLIEFAKDKKIAQNVQTIIDVSSQQINTLDAFLLNLEQNEKVITHARKLSLEKLYCWNLSLTIAFLGVYFSILSILGIIVSLRSHKNFNKE